MTAGLSRQTTTRGDGLDDTGMVDVVLLDGLRPEPIELGSGEFRVVVLRSG